MIDFLKATESKQLFLTSSYIVGISEGGSWRSASINTIWLPVAWLSPAYIAASLPKFLEKDINFTRLSFSTRFLIISSVLSEDPSSIKRNSHDTSWMEPIAVQSSL